MNQIPKMALRILKHGMYNAKTLDDKRMGRAKVINIFEKSYLDVGKADMKSSVRSDNNYDTCINKKKDSADTRGNLNISINYNIEAKNDSEEDIAIVDENEKDKIDYVIQLLSQDIIRHAASIWKIASKNKNCAGMVSRMN